MDQLEIERVKRLSGERERERERERELFGLETPINEKNDFVTYDEAKSTNKCVSLTKNER